MYLRILMQIDGLEASCFRCFCLHNNINSLAGELEISINDIYYGSIDRSIAQADASINFIPVHISLRIHTQHAQK